MKRLDKLATVILQATQGSLARRISAYAEKCRAKEAEKGIQNSIEDHIARVIDYRFRGSISPALAQQLIETFLYRHYRILYERSRQDLVSRLPVSHHVTDPLSQSHVVADERPSPSFTAGAEPKSTKIPERDAETRSEVTRPLTIDEKLVREKLAEDSSAQPQPASPLSVSETGAPSYPNPPHIPEGQTEAKCPICHRMLLAEELERHQWK